MARMTSRIGLGTLGLLTGLGAPHLAAQTWGLPASDPVGIARSGAGVAYGQSLEAAALNPALLATLRDNTTVFLAAGMELQSSQETLQANQAARFSTDRNRFLPSFGAAWRLNPSLVLGLKLDDPFMRHARMPLELTSRFQGQAIDLKTQRLEVQAGWAWSPKFSVGVSLGVTRVNYAWENSVRVLVPADPAAKVSPTNPSQGLMELGLRQEGNKLAPSYSVGFRWALSPRWTVGGAYVGSITAKVPLTASYTATEPSYYDNATGYGTSQPASQYGPALKALSRVQAGDGSLTLPGKATLGVRQRFNQLFTWEVDVRYVLGSAMALPGNPTLLGPGDPVAGPPQDGDFRSGFGGSFMGELTLGPKWTARMGVALDSALRTDATVDPVRGGAKGAAFSGGFGYRVWGGELNVGYQYRQSQDRDSVNLDGSWSASGYRTTGSTTRVEGMGHLWSVGFKKAF